MLAVTDASLAGQTVVAVLAAVSLNNLDVISAFLGVVIGPDRELDTID